MSILILTHVVTGLVGIATGFIVLVGAFFRRPMARWNAVFLSTTAAACATGFVFLPTGGVTSAQIVAFYSVFLLAVAAYARYVRRLEGSWNQVDVFTAVGAFFLNVLIATAQSFLHFRFLRTLAPTQHSPAYVAVKVTLFLLSIAVLFIVGKRADRQTGERPPLRPEPAE